MNMDWYTEYIQAFDDATLIKENENNRYYVRMRGKAIRSDEEYQTYMKWVKKGKITRAEMEERGLA